MPPNASAGDCVPAVRPRPAPAGLEPLLDDARLGLWRGHALARAHEPVCSSGYPLLDAELPGGGWPLNGLTEVLCLPGSGELSLLGPALAQASAARTGADADAPRAILWIAPPCLPYAPALHAMGLHLDQLTWIRPSQVADGAWAAEQALRSARCAWVLWWPQLPGSARDRATPEMLRRLHLAAQEGHAPLLALRSPAARSQASPAPLRLACEATPERGLAVEVFKRRGPALAAPLRIVLPHPVPGAQPGRPLRPGRLQGLAAVPASLRASRLPVDPARPPDPHAVVLHPSPARAA